MPTCRQGQGCRKNGKTPLASRNRRPPENKRRIKSRIADRLRRRSNTYDTTILRRLARGQATNNTRAARFSPAHCLYKRSCRSKVGLVRPNTSPRYVKNMGTHGIQHTTPPYTYYHIILIVECVTSGPTRGEAANHQRTEQHISHLALTKASPLPVRRWSTNPSPPKNPAIILVNSVCT